MTIKNVPVFLFNSLTNQRELFLPTIPGQVSMYVCGPTVYGDVHVGNLRPVVVFDVLRRFFIALGYRVHYVSNYTDIDDKIIDRAAREGLSEITLSSHYIDEFEKQVKAINSQLPDQAPKVTDYIKEMIAYIQQLINHDHAYLSEGDVYFRVKHIQDYGQLSGIKIDDLTTGDRQEHINKKEDPLDFALWKKTEKGMTFPAPFGEGRPGWHTECVVMIQDIFKQQTIDIHGGGFDLKFPHHENERAQHTASHHTHLARYWLHNGFVNIGGEKMSKSSGPLMLAKDFIQTYGGGLLRYILLSTHYRMPVNLHEDVLDNAKHEYEKITLTMQNVHRYLQLQNLPLTPESEMMDERFLIALADDLNIANALTIIQEHIKTLNVLMREKIIQEDALLNHFFTIQKMLFILGLPVDYAWLSTEDMTLYRDYLSAKSNKDFLTSDRLRAELMKRKII